MIGERPKITFVTPSRWWRAQMERLALDRRQAARNGAPDDVNKVPGGLEYQPQSRRAAPPYCAVEAGMYDITPLFCLLVKKNP